MGFKARVLAVAAVLVMAAAVIYGSTREEGVAAKEDQTGAWFGQKETIYFGYSDDNMTHYLNAAAVSFGETRGDVRVIPVLITDSEYLEAINRQTLQSEQTPDLYLLSNDSLEKAYLAGLASEVQDVQGFCTEDNFPRAALDAVSYRGKTIAYPMSYETSALVYNQTYLETWARQQAEKEIASSDSAVDQETGEPLAGAELDAAQVEEKAREYLAAAVPQTLDDLLNIADTFDAPEGVDGVMKWDVSDILYNYWIVGNYMIVGGDAGDDKSQINLDNSETVACLEVYKAMNQFFSIESDTVTYDSVMQDFIDGKIVFTIGTTDALARLAQAKEDGSLAFAYGIGSMPEVSGELRSRAMSVTNAVVVNGYSEHKELANEFATYLTGEYGDTLYEHTGKLSANKKVATDAYQQAFFGEYADSVALPKMMETGNFWIQLEVLFARVWNGEDVNTLVKELAENMLLQVETAE